MGNRLDTPRDHLGTIRNFLNAVRNRLYTVRNRLDIAPVINRTVHKHFLMMMMMMDKCQNQIFSLPKICITGHSDRK